MFDRMITNWHIVGSVAEENTETVHAKMNQMARRVGNLRGHQKKRAMIKAWSTEGAAFVSEGIKELLEATSISAETKDLRDAAFAIRKQKRLKAFTTARILREDADLSVGENGEDESRNDDEALSALHISMNADTTLHGPVSQDHKHFQLLANFNSHVCACKRCGKRVLGTASLKIHYNEIHSMIVEEADGAQNETLIKQALGVA